jgi:hypothetical protein
MLNHPRRARTAFLVAGRRKPGARIETV